MRSIGKQAFTGGDNETAERWLEQALALFRREGLHYGAAVALHNLGEIALSRGEHARAAVLRRDWLAQDWDATGLRFCLEALANVAVASGEMAKAARLLGAAEAHRARLGVDLMPRQVAGYERNVADARNALGEAVFAAAWAEGRRLSADEARAEAFRVIDAIAEDAQRPSSRTVDPALTPREAEVLRLVADGCSDREIAEALFVGTGTVRTHLAHVFEKLGVGSRTSAVAAASRLGVL
jgi:ATP/maltotriose-dependent transcriptional regulator MalT